MSFSADLGGKTALVTGASSGLGAHFSEMLAAAGAHVVLAARRLPAVEDVAERIAAAGGSAAAVPLDVADSASIDAIWSQVGAVDILVNNAGTVSSGPIVEQGEADWDRVVGTNARGAYLVARGAAREMIAAGRRGSIVNIASILGLRQAAQVASYAISKAAVVQMTKVMALEWARHGIRVNALCPGYIATPLNQEFFESEPGKALVRRIPQRRLGRLEDLKGPMLLLASDASEYITGAEIVVDGGHLVSTL